MLILYDLNHKKITGLTNYKELKLEREINQEDTLSFQFPITDPKHGLIQEECYIQTQDNEYVIKEVNTVDDDWDEYVCKINIEDIKGKEVSHFETVEQSCQDAVNLALAGTGWTIGSCDITKLRTVRKSKCNAYNVLQEIQSAYGCEMSFDAINKKVYIYQFMGSDKGVYFAEQLNLKQLQVQRNSYDYITKLIPIGKDGLDITSVNNNVNYIENHQYSDKVIAAYWEDNRYTVAQDLYDDAVIRLDYLSRPLKAYKATIIDLASTSDKYKNILDYGLGDTITLLSKSKNTKEKQRIVKTTEYPDEPERNTVEIANKIARLEDLQVRFQDTSDTVDSVTTSDGGLDGSKVDSIDAATQIKNLDSEVARITNLTVINANITDLQTNKANVDDLSAAVARIGTLETTTAHITNGIIDNATIDVAKVNNLSSTYATIDSLNAATGRITTLESQTASINNLLAGNLSASNMQAGFITADSGLIADAAISSAQIISLDVSKINAGTISTSKFTIQSDSGKLLMSDNTIQIQDASRVRVQIGKDASNDYNMYVWDASGNLMFDATGLKASGIKSKIIRDDMISDNANINGSKIERESLVSQINGATTLLKSSHVKYDPTGQTLEVAFSNLSNTVTAQGNTISSQGTSISTIQGQISSKIWQQDITTAVDRIQVGGRNLITGNPQNSPIEVVITNGYYKEYHTNIPLNAGQSYVFSWKYQINNSSIPNPDTSFTVSVGCGTTSYTRDIKLGTALNKGFIVFTPTADQLANGANFMYRLSHIGTQQTSDITYWSLKLEIGNIATDWTPAPEDTQDQIDAINTNITTNYSTTTQTQSMISSQVGAVSTDLHTNYSTTTAMNSAISQSASGVLSTVSSTYATQSNVNALTTRMTTAESSITQLNNNIALKVSTTDYNGNTIASLINQSSTTIKLQASKIDLTGLVTISSLSAPGSVTIDAGNISGGTLTLGGANNGNGDEKVYDGSGNLIASVDKNGIYLSDYDGCSPLSIVSDHLNDVASDYSSYNFLTKNSISAHGMSLSDSNQDTTFVASAGYFTDGMLFSVFKGGTANPTVNAQFALGTRSDTSLNEADIRLKHTGAFHVQTMDGADQFYISPAGIGAFGQPIINKDGNLNLIDTRSVDTPTDIGGGGVRFDFKANSTDGLSNGGVYHGVITLQQGGSIHQLGITDNGNLFIRTAVIGGTWGSWYELYSANNITRVMNANDGYEVFPDGMIHQWKKAWSTGINAGDYLDLTITYPIAFPTKGYFPQLTVYSTSTQPNTFVSYNLIACSNSQITVRLKPSAYTDGAFVLVDVWGY